MTTSVDIPISDGAARAILRTDSYSGWGDTVYTAQAVCAPPCSYRGRVVECGSPEQAELRARRNWEQHTAKFHDEPRGVFNVTPLDGMAAEQADWEQGREE